MIIWNEKIVKFFGKIVGKEKLWKYLKFLVEKLKLKNVRRK